MFPDDWQEVTIGNHRADVKTPHGVIEFQASSISSAEVQEREAFYGKMIWVVKADTFDLQARLSLSAKSFYYKFIEPYPEHPMDKEKDSGNLLDLLGLHANSRKDEQWQQKYTLIMKEVKAKREVWQVQNQLAWDKAWSRDPMYRWRWPRATWGFAKKKIYLDLGDQLFYIAWMSSDCKVIKGELWNKEKFVAKLLA